MTACPNGRNDYARMGREAKEALMITQDEFDKMAMNWWVRKVAPAYPGGLAGVHNRRVTEGHVAAIMMFLQNTLAFGEHRKYADILPFTQKIRERLAEWENDLKNKRAGF